MTTGTNHLDLSQYGIADVQEIYHNLSYEELYKHETDHSLEGFERGHLTSTGAVAVDTGIFTGRSPKDKYIVMEDENRDNIWWKTERHKSSDNKPLSEEIWNELWENSARQLSGKKLYVQDGFVGANEDTRMKVRFIMEVAWQAHFVNQVVKHLALQNGAIVLLAVQVEALGILVFITSGHVDLE